MIPKLIIKGRKVLYAFISIVMIIILAHTSAHTEIYVSEKLNVMPENGIVFFFSMSRFITFYTLAYALSTMIYFSRKTQEEAKQKEALLSEKKLLEARVLKSQINSHFIFNALNNIYSMIYFKDEYTSGYVLKLAQMMRYVMEDCETEITSLAKDIDYIENFIDFQKLRFENDKDIIFTYDIKNNGSIMIPPMIFQPLVENCFKHASLDVDTKSYVHIHLEADAKQIRFTSQNSQPMLKNGSSTKGNGIGIENVKRRLTLYYENNYIFEIYNNTDYFKVELTINL